MYGDHDPRQLHVRQDRIRELAPAPRRRRATRRRLWSRLVATVWARPDVAGRSSGPARPATTSTPIHGHAAHAGRHFDGRWIG